MMAVLARVFAVFMVSVLTGSCASLGPVRGIPPTLQASDIEAASNNYRRILYALAVDTGLPTAHPNWYLVSEAGFNYIDDRCSEYFYSLFRLNRRREAVKSGLNAFGQTTNAVLQATGATTVSMTVVAQAFGLATAMTDVVSGTFLYELPPATTREFVSKLQRAYRAGAAEDRAAIHTPTAAYHVIQEYLALCLPPTIEARISGHVANPGAVPEIMPGAGIDVLVGTQNPSVVKALADRARKPIVSVRERPRPAPAPTAPRCSPTDYEAGLDSSEIRDIQRTLCLEPTTGKLDRPTRQAVYDFFRGYDGKLRHDILDCGIQYGHRTLIDKAILLSGESTCSIIGYADAYAVGKQMRLSQ